MGSLFEFMDGFCCFVVFPCISLSDSFDRIDPMLESLNPPLFTEMFCLHSIKDC